MDQQIVDLIVGIIAVVLTYVLAIIRERDINLKIEDKFAKYSLLFDISGATIKMIDEKLYTEMEEAIAKMKEAYTSTTFTTQMFNEIVKECDDVFKRAQQLLDARK